MHSADNAGLFANAVRDFEVSNHLERAISLHTSGCTRDAAEIYKQILTADENNIAALNNLSLLLNDEAAVKLLIRALEINPDYVDALVNICSRYQNMGNTIESHRHLQHLLTIDPNNEVAKQLVKITQLAPTKNSQSEKMPKYSVIVPTHCRANLLDRALSSIKLQDCKSHHEVILVSDCVDAQTEQVCRRWLD